MLFLSINSEIDLLKRVTPSPGPRNPFPGAGDAIRPGHSVLTEPIRSVPRFLYKFSSQKIGTNKFFKEVGTEEIQFRLFRFGCGYNRINRLYLNIGSQNPKKGKLDPVLASPFGSSAPRPLLSPGRKAPPPSRARASCRLPGGRYRPHPLDPRAETHRRCPLVPLTRWKPVGVGESPPRKTRSGGARHGGKEDAVGE
jgi:hypothetical protein